MLLAGCGGGGSFLRSLDAPFPVTPDEVGIELINHNYYEARVYAQYEGGGRYPLGSVGPTGGTVTGLTIPWNPRPLCFEIDLVTGPGRYRSDLVLVVRGDVLQLTIPPNIATSGFFARSSCP